MSAHVKALSCPNCGGQVQVSEARGTAIIACGHCGSTLNKHENFKVAEAYQNRPKILTPFEVGQVALYRGVRFDLIGIAKWQQVGASRYTWVDHLLYSPTHGYLWVSLENGNYTVSRRVRGVTNPKRPVRYNPEVHQYLGFDGVVYGYWDEYTAELVAIEGEMNWHARLGETSRVLEVVKEPDFLEIELQDQEQILSKGHWLSPLAVQDMFGLETPPPQSYTECGPRPVHIGPIWARGFLPLFLVGLLCFIALMFFDTRTDRLAAARPQFDGVPSPAETADWTDEQWDRHSYFLPFTVPENRRLISLTLTTQNLVNAWAYFEIEVLDEDDETVAYIGREAGYYEGRDSDGQWREYERGRLRIKLPPGRYTTVLTLSETATARTPGRVDISIEGQAHNGKMLRWLGLILLATGVFWAYNAYKARENKWE